MCQQAETESNMLMKMERWKRSQEEEVEGYRDGIDGLPLKSAEIRANRGFYPEAYMNGYNRGTYDLRKK